MYFLLETFMFMVLLSKTSGTPAAGSNIEDSCSEEQLRRCADSAEPLLRNSELIVPSDLNAVNQVCKIWSDLTTCIADYTKRCMNPYQRQEFNKAMREPLISMSSLCGSSDQQNEYLRHAPCVKKISTQERYCGQQYKFLIDRVEESKSIFQVCCAREKFINCILAKTPSGCESNKQEKASNSTRLALAILDNSLAYMSQQCSPTRFQKTDCPGIDGSRPNSKGPLGNREQDTAASGEKGIGTNFQLDQPLPPKANGTPSTKTKEINEKKPATGQLSAEEKKFPEFSRPFPDSGSFSLNSKGNILSTLILLVIISALFN